MDKLVQNMYKIDSVCMENTLNTMLDNQECIDGLYNSQILCFEDINLDSNRYVFMVFSYKHAFSKLIQ